MDANQAELLRLIYTRIGMELEDAGIIALELGAPSSVFEQEMVVELGSAVEAISALTNAAKALADLGPKS